MCVFGPDSVSAINACASVEVVCGPGAPAGGPAVPDQRNHFQEDWQAGRYLLGCDEALWSHVS